MAVRAFEMKTPTPPINLQDIICWVNTEHQWVEALVPNLDQLLVPNGREICLCSTSSPVLFLIGSPYDFVGMGKYTHITHRFLPDTQVQMQQQHSDLAQTPCSRVCVSFPFPMRSLPKPHQLNSSALLPPGPGMMVMWVPVCNTARTGWGTPHTPTEVPQHVRRLYLMTPIPSLIIAFLKAAEGWGIRGELLWAGKQPHLFSVSSGSCSESSFLWFQLTPNSMSSLLAPFMFALGTLWLGSQAPLPSGWVYRAWYPPFLPCLEESGQWPVHQLEGFFSSCLSASKHSYAPPVTTLQEHSRPNPRKSSYPNPRNFVPLPESHENPVFSSKLSRSVEGLRFYPADKPTS